MDRGKRILDIVLSSAGLILSAPVLLPAALLIWLQDRQSPFYIAQRIGRQDRPFRMVKLRSMIVNADRTGIDSTSACDPRITALGRFIRRYKLDELPQLWNVLIGNMSLVGPRPNVKRGTDLYTVTERRLLEVQPGITDIASIVFADEGIILMDERDPDLAYDQLIRPWKSRLGLFYVEHRTLALDFRILLLTLLAIVGRDRALRSVARMLNDLGADASLCRIALRRDPLTPTPPPGSAGIETLGRAAASSQTS